MNTFMGKALRYTQFISRKIRHPPASISKRCFPTALGGDSFEGEMMGKHFTLHSKAEDGLLYFHTYAPDYFMLNSGLRVLGPIAAFPNSLLHWNVKDISEISVDSLRFFTLLEPKLDILVVGVGDAENLSKVDRTAIHQMLRQHKISLELLPTDAALSTFNYLNSERRLVGAALLPISDRSLTDSDQFVPPYGIRQFDVLSAEVPKHIQDRNIGVHEALYGVTPSDRPADSQPDPVTHRPETDRKV